MARASSPRSARTTRPRRRTGSHAVAGSALAQTLRVVLAHFADRGVSVAERREALEVALKRCDEPLQRHEASSLHSVRSRVELLAAWYRHERYCGADGQPLALPLRGTPSLEELLMRFLPTTDPAGLAGQLESEGVIRRTADERWLPQHRTLMVSSHSAGAIERVPYQVSAFLSTLAHNGRATDAGDRRLERTVTIDRLPVRLLPAFDQHSKRLGGQLIDDLDNWLLRREVESDSDEATVSVSVGVFAHVEDVAGSPTRPTRTRRRARRS